MVFPLSGFTAVPNPVMLSFMGAQSFIMMYMAGEAWQFGKRKISAMTNEEFNKLDPLTLLKQQQSTLKEAIPSMEQSMRDMTPMFKTITEEMLKAIPPIAKAIGEVLPDVVSEVTGIPILSGKEKEDYDKAFFDWWKNLFPNMPEAEARLSYDSQAGQRTGDFGLSLQQKSFIGPSKETNSQRAARLQAEHNEAVRKRLAENARVQKLNVHQIVADRDKAQGIIIKPKAGQTAIQQRDYFIRIIAALLTHSKRQGISPSQRTSFNKQRIKAQEQLAGLLARYRF